ncbi:MAG: hypothetical protein WBO17_00120 [Sphingorhabdus sp.]
MKRGILLILMLAACGEKDFDQHYAETERQLRAQEAKIDADMALEAQKEPGEKKLVK